MATDKQGGRALLLLCMAQFMLILDVAIVNVALPSIQKELHFSRDTLQLVVTAYVLTFGGLLLFGGRAADVLGRRRVFIGGLALFTLASLTCGIAPSAPVLVLARVLQGVGGAFVSPAALSLLISIFPEGPGRNRALAIWSALAAGGGAAGLLLGGVLTDLASWRWVFLINVLIGAVVITASFQVLPVSQPQKNARLDVPGAVTATSGLIALVYGLGQVGQKGFATLDVITLLILAVAFLAAFIVIEQRVREPLVPFNLFRLPTLTGANVATLLLSAVVLGVNYFLTLYFQQVLSYSPLETGLAFLPLTIISALISGIASRLVSSLGTRVVLIAGMLTLAVGAFLLSQITPHSSYVSNLLPAMVLVAVGLGTGYTVGTLAATAGVSPTQQGIASGILTTSQQLGGAIGLALLTTVASTITASISGSTASALTDGFKGAFLVMSGFGIAAALIVWVLVREHDCRSELSRRREQSAIIGAVPVGGTVYSAACQPGVTQLVLTPGHPQETIQRDDTSLSSSK